MQKRCVPVFVEPTYMASVWFSKSIAGLEDAAVAQGLAVRLLDSLDDLQTLATPASTVIIISSKTDWTHYMIHELKRLRLKVILVGAAPVEFGDDISGPVLNRRSLVEGMVHYFHACGRRRLASLGNNPYSSNDNIRCDAFLSATKFLGINSSLDDVFFADADFENCIAAFAGKAGDYDGVICANDYVAVGFLAEAKRRGIAVPDDLYVAGSGNMMIGSCCSPTLTTSTLDYEQMGAQSVGIWLTLDKNPAISSISITIPCEMICRGSTAFVPPPEPIRFGSPMPASILDVQVGPTALLLRRLESCLLQCDLIDLRIIRGVLDGVSYEALSNDLFVSQGTIHYRLKKMYASAGVRLRSEFQETLRKYLTNPQMLDDLLDAKARQKTS